MAILRYLPKFSRAHWLIFIVIYTVRHIGSISAAFSRSGEERRLLSRTAAVNRAKQTHEFIIHTTRQRATAGNSTICYRKKQIDVGF